MEDHETEEWKLEKEICERVIVVRKEEERKAKQEYEGRG